MSEIDNNDCNVAQECAENEWEMVMGDRKLLELAAKANGGLIYVNGLGWIYEDDDGNRGSWWNPLAGDGDALRLAVSLRIGVSHDEIGMKRFVYARAEANDHAHIGLSEIFDDEGERLERTRRAIVRVAAEIGKGL